MFIEFLIMEAYFIHTNKISVLRAILDCILFISGMIPQADSFSTMLQPMLSQR